MTVLSLGLLSFLKLRTLARCLSREYLDRRDLNFVFVFDFVLFVVVVSRVQGPFLEVRRDVVSVWGDLLDCTCEVTLPGTCPNGSSSCGFEV